MLKRAIDFVNANPAIIGIVMCLIGVGLLLIIAFCDKSRKILRKRIRKLKKTVASKERKITEKDQEIWNLKVELFAARQDRKISEKKLQAEIENRDAKIRKLETEKKQLLKWEVEK